MKHKLRNQSFHSFLQISSLSLLMLIVIMSWFMYHSYQAMIQDRKMVDDSMNLIVAADSLQKGSDILTEKIRFFVLTKDETYAQQFIEEAYTTKTRDTALQVLYSKSFEIDYTKLETVKAMSDSLLQKELWLMRLVYDSVNSAVVPTVVQQVDLTAKEAALSPAEKNEIAEAYLLFGEYNALKLDIDLMIADVNTEMHALARAKVAEINQTTYLLLLSQMFVFVLFVVWCSAILVILNWQIVKPIRSYKNVYQTFDYDAKELSLVHPNGMEEVYQLGEVYNNAMMDLNQLKCTVEEKNIALEIQKNLDPLTGVYNRGFFDTAEWSHIEKSNYTIFCIDVNKFKEINDTYGHVVGDKALQFIAQNLQNVIRKTDVVIRSGGDEFVVVLKDMVDEEIIARISNQFEALQGKTLRIDEFTIPTYFGYGFASHTSGNQTFEEVLHLADERMYTHKNSSSNPD